MIVGVGVDVVDIARFEKSLQRTPGLVDRLFTAVERDRPTASLAARFAAKEAVAKALGAPAGLQWHDVEVRNDDSGRPVLTVTGTVAAASAAAHIDTWHVSLTHDGGTAMAMVVGEGRAG